MTALVFVLAVLAGARTYDLLMVDDITVRLRDWLYSRKGFWTEAGNPSQWQNGFECQFCFGFWYTGLWVLTGVLWGDTIVWLVLAGAFAANYVQGHLNARFYRGL